MNRLAPIDRLSLSRPIRQIYLAVRRTPLIGSTVRRVVQRIFPGGTRVWARIHAGHGKGLWIHVDPRFEMDYVGGSYEAAVEQLLFVNLRPGSVFYDVGAHIGVLSLVAARLVETSGRVFAFEADPANAARVQEHALRNGFVEIHVVPRAVWSSTGRLRFERASTQSSRNQGGVATEQAERTANTIDVEAVTLDDFAGGHAPPDLIKIDVEGAEVEVIRGARRLLMERRPGVVCELHSEENRRILGEEFARLGYDCHSCGAHHILAIPR